MSAAHEQQYKCTVISLSVLLTMRNISHKSCIENYNKFLNFFFFQNCAVGEIEWKNIAEHADCRLQYGMCTV